LAVWLQGHPTYGHATFVVDVEPALASDSEFRSANERLIARNRHRQMTAPSLAFPGWNTDTKIGPCALDGLRAGTEPTNLPGYDQPQPVSPSARARWDFGREQKRAFYCEEAGADRWPVQPNDQSFAQSFEDIAHGTPAGCERLNDKLAVIYLDGNRFGELQRAECNTKEVQMAFDGQVRELRRGFLGTFLDLVRDNEELWNVSGDRRVETLLWGGDELMFVVPAWAGWDALRLFFEVSANWKVKLADTEHQLTHAGALVFAHHKAPIHRLQALAKWELADGVKGWLGKRYAGKTLSPRDPAANRFDYEVLESFDHLGGCLTRYRQQRYPAWLEPSDFHVGGSKMAALAATLRALAQPAMGEPFPTRQLHANVRRLVKSGSQAPTAADFAKSKLEPELRPYAETLTQLAGLVPPATLWFHLAALWDYVARTPHSLASRGPSPSAPAS
jgi:hypothetical protein